jgi:hypothetical protein
MKKLLTIIGILILFLGIAYATVLLLCIRHAKIKPAYYDLELFKKPKERVIVTFSTLPSRVFKVQEVVDNMNKQSLKPDLIMVNIPYYSKREETEYKLPFIKGDNVQVNRTSDYGPLTKIRPAINRIDAENKEDIIISIDDDEEYDKDFIKSITHAMNLYPNTCITYGGWNYYYNHTLNLLLHLYAFYGSYVDILHGYRGTAYRRKFFDKIRNSNKECFTVDDIYISNLLRQRGIPILKLPYSGKMNSPIIKRHRLGSPLGSYNLRNMVWGKCIRHNENSDI